MIIRTAVVTLLALLAGCAEVAGLPDATAQVRVWEGQANIAGGNLLMPARGEAAGVGCIVSEVGIPQAEVMYLGERCRVCYPRCEPAPAVPIPPLSPEASEAPDSISP